MLKVLFTSLLAIVIDYTECVLVSLDQCIKQALQVHMKLFENGFSMVGDSKWEWCLVMFTLCTSIALCKFTISI